MRVRPARPLAAALALVILTVPIAERICDLRCEAIPIAGEPAHAACPAHLASPKPSPPRDRDDPCGHAHASEGILIVAASKNVEPRSGSVAAVPEPVAPLGKSLPLCRDDFLRLPAPSRARPAPAVLRL